ncbi:hypothetical protein JTE90_002004 [Oedothorax gibbosus]|uniref:Uncharacterized protein n=1 Tax=Oedothorax gibbosus TaxID=931172 RepID=A0AAV6U819_9ARAC|nr:hypothetical protein JTE90_002004 [Oedothorax gibbosus]
MADDPDPTPSASSTLPRSARRCRIPRLNRSVSVRSNTLPAPPKAGRPKSITVTGDYPHWPLGQSVQSMIDDDCASSVRSFGSFASYASFASQSQCGTEASVQGSRPVSRCHYGKRYVLHCDRHPGKPEEYLTPTQRKDKEIRQLKSTLARTTKRCDDKDAEIEALRGEMARLRDALTQLQLGNHGLLNSSQDSNNLEANMNGKNNQNNSSVISFESNSSDDLRTSITINHHNNDDSGISTSISPRNSSEEFDDHVAEKVDKCVNTDEVVDFPTQKSEVDYPKSKPEVNEEYSKPKPEVNTDYLKSKEESAVNYLKPKTEVYVDYPTGKDTDYLKLKTEVYVDYKPKAELNIEYSKPKPEVIPDYSKPKVEYSRSEMDNGVAAVHRRRSDISKVENHQSPVSVTPSEFERFLDMYKKEIDQLKSQHKEHYQDLKERFDDRVDDLLQKLTETNARYLELRPLFDHAQSRIQDLEDQMSHVKKDMEPQEDNTKLRMLRWKKYAFRSVLCATTAAGLARLCYPLAEWGFTPALAYSKLRGLAGLVEFRALN